LERIYQVQSMTLRKLRKPGEQSGDHPAFEEKDLVYAATERCICGAGLAHWLPRTALESLPRAWVCSRILKGDVSFSFDTIWKRGEDRPPNYEHDQYPFDLVEIISELVTPPGVTTRGKNNVAV
ncbi:MAG: hypothetical protein ACXWOH_09485, partial [Bdellovibrionota bacterium]